MNSLTGLMIIVAGCGMVGASANAQCVVDVLEDEQWSFGSSFGGSIGVLGDKALIGYGINFQSLVGTVATFDGQQWSQDLHLSFPALDGTFFHTHTHWGDTVAMLYGTSDTMSIPVVMLDAAALPAEVNVVYDAMPPGMDFVVGGAARTATDERRAVVVGGVEGQPGMLSGVLFDGNELSMEPGQPLLFDAVWDGLGRLGVCYVGDSVLIGIPGSEWGGADNLGAVFVLEADGSDLTTAQTLLPESQVAGRQYGAVIDADGNRLAVLYRGTEQNDLTAIDIYELSGGSWMRTDTVDIPSPYVSSYLNPTSSSTMAVSDNRIAVVGYNELTLEAVVLVFTRIDDEWMLTHEILASDLGVSCLGASIDIEGDRLLVRRCDGEPMQILALDLAGDDCNGNAICDATDILDGTSMDVNGNGVPDECECVSDIDGDGATGTTDLLTLLAGWGACVDPPIGCAGDITFDGVVDVADLLVLIAAWGGCP
jgi:hypothetical protein